ncbi:hypothetical protein [Fusobacterium varium]|uniref:hypothetical protein n=1 Tax=Fusobacterium varium TaxID=856 RepID=UPI0035667431
MKTKIVILLMLIISTLSFADEKFTLFEENMELNHEYITDGNHKLKITDIDIGITDGVPFVILKTESTFNERDWKKFDKKIYNQIAGEIADEVRGDLNTDVDVNIILILNKDLGEDKVLSEAQY